MRRGKVLQGRGAGRASLRQRDVGPLINSLARLEGFHIHAAYRMAKKNKPRRGPGHRRVYPKSADVLEECGLKTIAEYIDVRRQTIAENVVTRSILEECVQGERKRGAIPHRWWWEQKMDLDIADATGSDE